MRKGPAEGERLLHFLLPDVLLSPQNLIWGERVKSSSAVCSLLREYTAFSRASPPHGDGMGDVSSKLPDALGERSRSSDRDGEGFTLCFCRLHLQDLTETLPQSLSQSLKLLDQQRLVFIAPLVLPKTSIGDKPSIAAFFDPVRAGDAHPTYDPLHLLNLAHYPLSCSLLLVAPLRGLLLDTFGRLEDLGFFGIPTVFRLPSEKDICRVHIVVVFREPWNSFFSHDSLSLGARSAHGRPVFLDAPHPGGRRARRAELGRPTRPLTPGCRPEVMPNETLRSSPPLPRNL
ncbi:hypothetical protein EYF80_029141 [Liparis tanakae]|uniref:Uncharacterized protein n=1 Tax=Liparis tanakae TaxID=230148 RepID=A0A4Z2H494_9TELE|nr:hypothetical protein EYF80_029141 [Liparis tanakae]